VTGKRNKKDCSAQAKNRLKEVRKTALRAFSYKFFVRRIVDEKQKGEEDVH